MRSARPANRGRRFAIYIVAVLMGVMVLGASLGLMGYIDHKLKQGAEQQVITFTQQAAGNVADRIFIIQSAIGAFEVQSADPDALVPALMGMRERFGFTEVAFAGMDGEGIRADGSPFSTEELVQPETALSQQVLSYSGTFELEDGSRVRLAQRPLFVGGRQFGALYVQIPLSMFSMPRQLDMFDGRGYFMLFEEATGEILVRPSDGTKTPVNDGMTVYAFLEEAGLSDADDDMLAPGALADPRAGGKGGISLLGSTVASGQTGMAVGNVDGKESYVCVTPVGVGSWYVCNVIPVENVRAEASVVLTSFKAVFGIVIVCFAAVVALTLSAYRKRMLDRTVDMKARLYKALSDSLDMAVNLYSPLDKKVTPIVAKADRILGYSMPELMADDHAADALALSDDGRQLLDRLHKGEVEGLVKGGFSFTHKPTGKMRWISYSANPLCYEGKRQVLVVFRDATTEKELQLSMKDAMTAAEAANRAKSEFLSRMSHEIRTPMNAIIGMLQIAKLHPGDEERTRENLQKIGVASDHLLNLINDVLDISKIESGKTVLSSVPFSLYDLIKHVEAVIVPQCEQRGHAFDLRVAAADDVFVGDAVRLRQMLINLLTNSVKYTPAGGRVGLEVAVGADSVPAYRRVTFVVSDTGIGMTEEFREHLFEPFVMEGRSHAQGTGLGMPIVKNIVTMMGGDIHVDTAVDRGSTFTVVVNLRLAADSERNMLALAEREGKGWEGMFDVSGRPMGQPPASLPAPGREAREAGAGEAVAAVGRGAPAGQRAAAAVAALEGARVLLAEDNELNAEIARELLGEAGLLVDWAENGEVACRMFEESAEGHYDVVLMDVQMPVLDGYGATRCIRALPRADAACVPIIAMSANAFSEDVRASLESGMDAHLSKPIDMRRVLEEVAAHLQRRRAR